MPFVCSICGEESTRICARCTKDACENHLCEKCLRCSDCCECEVTVAETAPGPPASTVRPPAASPVSRPPSPEPPPEAPLTPPEPGPLPPAEPEPEAGPAAP